MADFDPNAALQDAEDKHSEIVAENIRLREALEDPLRHVTLDDPWVLLPKAWLDKARAALEKRNA